MKLSYVNSLAELCERLSGDIGAVTAGIGYDRSVGHSFLSPGPGWGGSCLPKDTQAMLQIADSVDFEFRLLRATIETNDRQRQRMVDKVRVAVTGSRVGSLSRTRLGSLGLTFKAGTDDTRDSPSLAIAALFRQAGAIIFAYDPAIAADTVRPELAGLTVVYDPYLAAKDVDALVILTEWPDFRVLDWSRMANLVSPTYRGRYPQLAGSGCVVSGRLVVVWDRPPKVSGTLAATARRGDLHPVPECFARTCCRFEKPTIGPLQSASESSTTCSRTGDPAGLRRPV